ncbi:hypothetical protein [Streptomyces sp. NPDC015680]|uniref:hypothetical protein n=1 Tax=Streptomyces sp. NPDC015680 TaxID=3364962 RepID=UPI0037005FD4
MAVSQLSATPCAPHVSQPAPLPAPPHPMANPGYGKRSAPDEHPAADREFGHLPPREASIAAYIDRLPEGADISVKTLAKHLPYGQCALRTALNRLQDAGHLRRGSECVANDEVLLWVTRTFFSRTSRDDEWWAAFTRGDVPPEQPRRPTRSRAFMLLAALGRTAPSLTLSAADCTSLEPQVSAWFEHGATEPELLHALTDGLPTPVHHAAALVRRRLIDKMPPQRVAPTQRRTVLRTLECSECRTPGSAEALIGGRCRPCRGEVIAAPAGPGGAVPADGVRSRMNDVRAGLARRTVRTGRPAKP